MLAIAFDAAGRSGRIATASTDQTARVWRLPASRSIATLFGHTGPVNDVAFGPGSVLATASGDGTARTWRAEGDQAQVLLGHEGPVRKVEFASDGTVVTGGVDGTLRIWDPGTSIDLVRASNALGPSPPQRDVSTADGSARARVDGNLVRLRTASGEQSLEGHKDEVNSVSFSPDGRLLVSAGRDHDVIVWDVGTGRVAFRLDEAQSASVTDARFSPDGRWLVTAGPSRPGSGLPRASSAATSTAQSRRSPRSPSSRTRVVSSPAKAAASCDAGAASSAATSTSSCALGEARLRGRGER